MRRFLLPLLLLPLLFHCIVLGQSSQSGSNSSAHAKANKQAKTSETKAAGVTVLPKAEEPKHDYSQEGFVIEKSHSTYRFESDGTGRKETVVRIRVQSEAGVQQWGQIQAGYNSANERLEIVYVRVVKSDGSIVKAGEDAVQDLTAPVERGGKGA